MAPTRRAATTMVFDDGNDPVATFVHDNRGVYDALQALLLDAHRSGDTLLGLPLKARRWARLVGGASQWQVLTALAEENGLVVDQHVGALRIAVPQRALELVVTADLGAPDPQPQSLVG